MDYIKRDIETVILETSGLYAAVLVTGPRQVGKTTTLQHLMGEEREYITLDSLDARKMAQTDPVLQVLLKLLDAGAIPRGSGAILCTKEEFSAVSRDVFIVPVWMI